MTSQIGTQTNIMDILSDILRDKGNQATKFVQLIEYKVAERLFTELFSFP